MCRIATKQRGAITVARVAELSRLICGPRKLFCIRRITVDEGRLHFNTLRYRGKV